jgi:NAD(P)-dependent dehydrogenase (short-subunit alcohol dehydrogenase family)
MNILTKQGADGIRVNAVLPGPVRGTRAQKVIADYAKANRVSEAEAEAVYVNRQATGRYVEPEEVAATILYLASDAARSITGQFVSVDGGLQ